MKAPIILKATEKTIQNEIVNNISPLFRNKEGKYLGYSFKQEVELPELRRFEDGYKILMPISSKKDPIKAVYEMAHEFIHLIAPIQRHLINSFEEGLATKFQLDFIVRYRFRLKDNRFYHEAALEKIQNEFPNYFEVYNDILALEQLYGQSIYKLSKALFDNEKILSFGNINPYILKKETGLCSEDKLFERLSSKFYSR